MWLNTARVLFICYQKCASKVTDLVLNQDFQYTSSNSQEIVEDYQQIPEIDKFQFLDESQRLVTDISKVHNCLLQSADIHAAGHN